VKRRLTRADSGIQVGAELDERSESIGSVLVGAAMERRFSIPTSKISGIVGVYVAVGDEKADCFGSARLGGALERVPIPVAQPRVRAVVEKQFDG
jgi:hypothetical protein